MHFLEKHFGKNFFNDLEKEIGFDITKPSNTHFEITVRNRVLDFSIIEKQNVLIIGFPFKVETKHFGGVQYKEYVKFVACLDNKNQWIKAVKERVVKYTEGYYRELEENDIEE